MNRSGPKENSFRVLADDDMGERVDPDELVRHGVTSPPEKILNKVSDI